MTSKKTTKKKTSKKKTSKKKTSKKKTSKKKTSEKKTSKKKVAKKKKSSRGTLKNKVTKTNPRGAGAKRLAIDWDTVDKLGLIQCTGEEIASVLNINYETLQRTCKIVHKVKFMDYLEEKKKGGRASLRRRQWELVNNANPTMCIWLGKQYLGQKDKQDFSSDDGSLANDNLTPQQRESIRKLNDEEY